MSNSNYPHRNRQLKRRIEELATKVDPVTSADEWRTMRRGERERTIVESLQVAYNDLDLDDRVTVDYLTHYDLDTVARFAALLDLAYTAGMEAASKAWQEARDRHVCDGL